MFKRILIANRGEIAVRIIRACQELDIETIAIYSEADANALHVQLADHKVCVGGADASDSYLNKTAILRAAIETDTVLELNTRRLGSRLACKELVPVYTRYRELGGRFVTLGSDAHTADAIAANFGAAEELAAMVGLGLVTFAERRMVPCTK